LETLIIPKEIDGKPVTDLGQKTLGGLFVLKSEKLKVLNIPETVTTETSKNELTALETLIYNSVTPVSFGRDASMWLYNSSMVKIYVPKGYVKEYKDAQSFSGYSFYDANISFMYNYADSVNGGFYFVHHAESGQKIFKPQEPKREHYIFTGWYEDEECLMEYDFNAIFDVEKTLFAGWQLQK
jgi:hypothetical protein